MLRVLKNPDIKRDKPTLKLKTNHYHFLSKYGRTWNSYNRGTAVSDGKGWYK